MENTLESLYLPFNTIRMENTHICQHFVNLQAWHSMYRYLPWIAHVELTGYYDKEKWTKYRVPMNTYSHTKLPIKGQKTELSVTVAFMRDISVFKKENICLINFD